jgi:FkbM family methyltransferase
MKQAIQDAIGRFGYELHRKRPAFQPYVERFAIAGVTFQFWVGDQTGRDWYSPEGHAASSENKETARLVKPGDRVLEIGAHHGFTGMLLSQLVGETGFVLCVEPSPFNAMMVSAQIGLNRAVNCHVLQAAAADRCGTLTISRASDATVTNEADGIRVRAVTADEMDQEFGPFNVLKIDVEGFEH